ncbi:conserved hypothetical protein [Ricinus communis]|uniref:Wall-associated receptor kinase C-terminal domain-containing protein n=1 Tax=Ricinus communis TaxID=3988 RepID=B9RFJ8_RICCO|nr:conserved hypothetical protein [Ricinus communis]
MALEKQNGNGSTKTLQEGFKVSWSLDSNCRKCEGSGGACGYYVNSAWNFKCFYPTGKNHPKIVIA